MKTHRAHVLAGALALAALAPSRAETVLPDPLRAADGTAVTSAESWRTQRRPEILDLFRTHVYGRAPVGRPDTLTFQVEETAPGAMDGAATRKQVRIAYRGPGGEGSLRLLLFVPARARRPAPCFLLICHRPPENMDPARAVRKPFWPAEEIVARGYAAAAFQTADLDPDRHDGFTNGVHGIFDDKGKPRPPDAWGTIAAWAWGASRAMDYLVTDPDIDARRVAVLGHSRGGKTALWAGAEDERFALVISNDSGCTGAQVVRRRTRGAETIAMINKNFPHWFCENYKRYGEREDELPVDQHMLAALIAPRLLYIASAAADAHAGPEAEFASAVGAGPVYRLLGGKGLSEERFPAVDAPLADGDIGYHVRTGTHDLGLYDWQRFLDFADRHGWAQ